jgi:hypothetical protein
MKLYSDLVDLHDGVLKSTGKDLGPVEKIKLIAFNTESTLVTPAHSEPNNESHDKGTSESNSNGGVITVMGKLKHP